MTDLCNETFLPSESENRLKGREKWTNKSEFFMTVLGTIVGYGNIWRFPFLCYKNGGGAFLIPYGLTLLIVGFPIYFLEMFLGQYFSAGPAVIFSKMKSPFKGLGFSMVIFATIICFYYNILFAWTLFYLFSSFTSTLPWASCNNDFNSPNCFTKYDSVACQSQGLMSFNGSCVTRMQYCSFAGMNYFNGSHCERVDNSSDSLLSPLESSLERISSSEDFFRNRMLGVTGKSWENMGSLRLELVGCLALAWILTGACIIRGIKTTGKVAYVTATAPIIIILAFIIRGATLEGAYKGVEFYLLKINISKLLQIEVWNEGATQIIYSLGFGYGGIMTLSSYNLLKNNCLRDAALTGFGNSMVSIYSGFAVFMVLGFMANELEVDISKVVKSGSGLAFIAYPEAISKMPLPNLWSVLFFLMLITVGIDSQMVHVEVVATAIFDKYPLLRRRKSYIVATLCVFMFICGIPMCLEGGIFLLDLIIENTAMISLPMILICEVLSIHFTYGFSWVIMKLNTEMEVSVARPIRWYLIATWKYLAPLSTSILLVLSLYYYRPVRSGDYVFPPLVQGLGWCICAATVVCIPLCFLYEFLSRKKRKDGALEAEVTMKSYVAQDEDNVRNSINSL